jgi:hypothetical protein
MDHQTAQASKATERYLLGEMSEPERFDFESHYFECEECADDVRAAHALARGIKAVCADDPVPEQPRAVVVSGRAPRRGWLAWLSPAALAPSAIAAGLAVVVGYQAWFVIPNLRWQTAAMAPTVLRPAARGEEQAVEIHRHRAISLVSFDVNGPDPGTPLTYDLIGPGGAHTTDTTTAPPIGTQLVVALSSSQVRQPGNWTLVLRTQKGEEVARYPFVVELK